MNVIIYTRFSPRPNAQECDSCEKQYERCEKYCREHEYEITAEYKEINTSGGTMNRPVLNEAIMKLNDAHILIVDSVDRLSRDMLVALTIRHEVEKRGSRIEYANGTPNNMTPEGKLFSNILAAFAAYERDRIRFATSRGIKRRQSNGEWFGKPPVGWERDPTNSKKLIECKQEQEAIKKINYLSGLGYDSTKIARLISSEYGLFRGKPWSPRTIRKILEKNDG